MLSWIACLCLLCCSAAGFAATGASSGDALDKTDGDLPRILVLGDSLSAAYNIPRQAGWVNLLRERLHEKVPGAEVINGSVSGATTAAGLQVLPELLREHNPTLVILELGANDGLQGKPLGYIKTNLQRLIALCLQADAAVILAGIRLPPNYGPGYTEPFFNQYAALAASQGLGYVPFILDGVAGRDGMMQADRLHPVADAQPRVLDNVWPAVAAELGLSVDKVRNADPH